MVTGIIVCDQLLVIQASNLYATMFQNIILYLPISCRPSFVLHQLLNIHIDVDMYCRLSQN